MTTTVKMVTGFLIACFALGICAEVAQAATLYVSPEGNDGDGLSWENAKTTIQAAIDVAPPDSTVLVTNGVYDSGSVVGAGNLKCRVMITNNVTVRSVQPHGAVIRGSGLQHHGDTANAIRCVEISSGTLDGFIVEEGTTGGLTYNNNSLAGGIFFHDQVSSTATNCIIRNCKAGGGGATFRGVLRDCVLSNNVATGADGGGAMYIGKAYGCLIAHNQALDGSAGGVYGHPSGDYYDCTIRDNTATRVTAANNAYGGGGAFYGTFYRCAISNNTVTGFGNGGGGGTRHSTLTDCVIANNMAQDVAGGGGACGGTLTRCLVIDNTITNGSGGGTCGSTLYQCSVLSNNLTSYKKGNSGGVIGGSAYNTLIAYNRSHSVGGAFDADLYNCTVVSNTAISENAPGIHIAGSKKVYNCLAFGNTGGSGVDVGKVSSTSVITNTFAGTADATHAELILIDPSVTPVFTDFNQGDFSLCAGSPAINAGDMTVARQTTDLAGNARVLFGTIDVGAYEYNQMFVATNGNDAADGRSWADAKQTIQAAVDTAEASMVVWVSNGVYATGAAASPYGGALSNRVVITKAIRVKSVNGPAQTVIRGSGTATYNTDGAIRCVFMNNGVLDGFTVEEGVTKAGGGVAYEHLRGGGGICLDGPPAAGTCVTNCVIRNNRGYTGGGITGGTATPRGGATVCDCVITNNASDYGGGVAYGAVFERCVITHNTAAGNGGGCYEPFRVDNSLIAANVSPNCGGVYGPALLVNCTVAHNTGSGVTGVGSHDLHVYATNCVIWGNSGTQYGVLCHFGNCCCSMAGDGITVTADPLFMDVSKDDFRLQPASPCIDAGVPGSAVGTLDLAGNARVVNGIVDIGAFESPSFRLVIFDVAPGVFVGLGTSRLDVYVPRTNLVYGSFLPTNAVFRSGYMPVGWYSSPGGEGVAIQAETPFISPDTHTVYMHWLRRGTIIKLF